MSDAPRKVDPGLEELSALRREIETVFGGHVEGWRIGDRGGGYLANFAPLPDPPRFPPPLPRHDGKRRPACAPSWAEFYEDWAIGVALTKQARDPFRCHVESLFRTELRRRASLPPDA